MTGTYHNDMYAAANHIEFKTTPVRRDRQMTSNVFADGDSHSNPRRMRKTDVREIAEPQSEHPPLDTGSFPIKMSNPYANVWRT